MLNPHVTIKSLLIFCVAMVGVTSAASAAEIPQVGDEMAVVAMYWAKRNIKDIAKRVHTAADLVANRQLKTDGLGELMRERGVFNHWISPFEDAPELKVKIIRDYDEVRVINRKLVDQHDGKDVGKKQAIEIAAKFMDQLRKAGVLNHRDFNLDDVQIGYSRVGEGSMDGKVHYESVVEYRVTFRPNIDGIQLANAGVRLAVHRSGALAGIRFGGVSVKERKRKTVVRKVPSEKIEARLKRMIPKNAKPAVAWSRVMYVMPEEKREALVEPLQIYSYSLITESDGEPVVSRRKTVGFSLSNVKAKVVDFTAPAREHQGTKPERKEESVP